MILKAQADDILKGIREAFQRRDEAIDALILDVQDLKKRLVDATNTMSYWQGRAVQLEADRAEKARELETLERAYERLIDTQE